MTALEAATLAKAAQSEELILTHFSARYLDTTLFEKEAQIVFANSHAAHDLQRFAFPKHKPSI